MKDKLVIGHRGAAAYAPENTMISFQKAKELGCEYIEFDVRQSRDGELFIFHDDLLTRTTNGQGTIETNDSSYIKSLDAGKWFSEKYSDVKIPTLKETISWLSQNDMRANIEIKPSNTNVSEIIESIVNEIDLFWPATKDLPIISSFNYDALLFCNKIKPNLPLAFLLNRWRDDWWQAAQKINCKIINISKKIASKEIISEIKDRGLDVNVFTINNRRLAYKLFDYGVSAVFSDYPDLFSV